MPRLTKRIKEAIKCVNMVTEAKTVGSCTYHKRHSSLYNKNRNTIMIWGDHPSVRLYCSSSLSEICGGNYSYAGHLTDLIASLDNANRICTIDNERGLMAPVSTRSELYRVAGYSDLKSARKFYNDLVSYGVIIPVGSEKGGDARKQPVSYYINPRITIDSYGLHPETYSALRTIIDPWLTKEDRERIQRTNYLYHHKDVSEDSLPSLDELTDWDAFDERAIPGLEMERCFEESVYAGKEPDTYIKSGNGIARGVSDVNMWFTPNKVSAGERRTAENVVEYRNFFVDLDEHEDDLGKLAEIKEDMRGILELLRPSAIVETYHGLQAYWSISPEDYDKKKEWQELENNLVSMLAPVADQKVRDPSRILRVPGTTHKKENLEPFEVKLLYANRRTERLSYYQQMFSNRKDAVAEAIDGFIQKHPRQEENTCRNGKAAGAAAGEKTVVKPELKTPRLKAISDLSTDTFNMQMARVHMTRDEAKDFLHHVDLWNFLQIRKSTSFDCIFHETIGGDGRSASIYPPKQSDKVPAWRYACHCLEDKADIIDCVMMLAGCSYNVALSYLEKLFNIKERK